MNIPIIPNQRDEDMKVVSSILFHCEQDFVYIYNDDDSYENRTIVLSETIDESSDDDDQYHEYVGIDIDISSHISYYDSNHDESFADLIKIHPGSDIIAVDSNTQVDGNEEFTINTSSSFLHRKNEKKLLSSRKPSSIVLGDKRSRKESFTRELERQFSSVKKSSRLSMNLQMQLVHFLESSEKSLFMDDNSSVASSISKWKHRKRILEKHYRKPREIFRLDFDTVSAN